MDTTILPFAANTFGDINSFILQEDNCGQLRALSIRAYLQDKGVNRMNWPPQSPDLNPIENVCGLLKNKLRRLPRHPSQEELLEVFSKLWKELPQSYFTHLSHTMVNRVRPVMRAEGRSTKY